MPILVLGASVWYWLLGSGAVVSGGVGSWFAGSWISRKLTERKQAQMSAAFLAAYRAGGRDGLQAYLLESGIAVTDLHCNILMKHVLPQVVAAAAAAEMAENLTKAKAKAKAADADADADAAVEEAPAPRVNRRIEAPQRIRAVESKE